MTTNQQVDGPSGTERSELVDALAQAAFVTMGVLSKVSAANDLSLTQLRALAILRDRRLRMTALADYLGLDKSTMTGLVSRAERRGLLVRAPNVDDRRAVDVLLSAGGLQLADRIYLDVERALVPMLDELPTADQRRLRTLLARMLAPRGPDGGASS
jgi:DNA-binding MarR family transcriptional regulator